MHQFNKALGLAAIFVVFIGAVAAQQRVMWSAVNVRSQNLLHGPAGQAMKPDISSVTFVKEDTAGNSLKYRIKDAKGNEWVAKIGNEAQAETAAVRLLQGIGYKTETIFMVPELTIPTKGTFKNVRLEARPASVGRVGRWDWSSNPFKGTREFQGLKVMMAFFANWDMKDVNNSILRINGVDHYVVSDLGTAFGKTGSVGAPLFWMIGRSRNVPADYQKAEFVKGVRNGKVELEFNGKNGGVMKDITVEDVRWITSLLSQYTDQQIRDAFRSANYSPSDVEVLTQGVKRRISELRRMAPERNIGGN